MQLKLKNLKSVHKKYSFILGKETEHAKSLHTFLWLLHMFLEVVNFAEKYASDWLSTSLLTWRSNKFRISSVTCSLWVFLLFCSPI